MKRESQDIVAAIQSASGTQGGLRAGRNNVFSDRLCKVFGAFAKFNAAVAVFVLVWIAADVPVSIARAQTTAPQGIVEPAQANNSQPATGSEKEVRPRRIEEISPEIFYLENEAGSLVPVPGFRYRDFVELLRVREGLPPLPQAPDAVLERLDVRCSLEQKRAETSVVLSVQQSRPGWVRVPLALGAMVISESPRYQGQGRMLVDVEDSQRAYQVWLEGKSDTLHEITLKGFFPVDGAASRSELSIDLPRATASFFELTIPESAPSVVVRPEFLAPRIEKREEGGSRIVLVGQSGPTTIVWGPPESGSQNIDALPQAISEMVVRIDGRSAVTEASFSLTQLPATRTRLEVALPANALLRRIKPPSMLVETKGSVSHPIAVIDLVRTRDASAQMTLECESPVDPTGKLLLESLGFEISGIPAWRQWGRMSVYVEGDWQVDWDGTGRNRQADPPASTRREGFVAAFEYDSQPASLPLRVRPRGSRVVMEPEYRVDVGATRISLNARLRTAIRGAAVSQLSIALEGWEVDDVGPAGLIDQSRVSLEDGMLEIPFMQPISGDFEIEIRGGRSIEREETRLKISLPEPLADLVSPAVLLVSSASDIELSPDPDASHNLVRTSQNAQERDRMVGSSLSYRQEGPRGGFEATRRFLTRRVNTTLSARIVVDPSTLLVEEVIRLNVSHVPLETLELIVPVSVLESEAFEVLQDDIPLTPPAAPTMDESSETIRWKAPLPRPILGAGEIRIRYEISTPELPVRTTVAEDVPLVLPAKEGPDSIALVVQSQGSIAVELRGDAWKRELGGSGDGSRSWLSSKSETVVPLALVAQAPGELGQTVIEASLFETQLSKNRREDSFFYRFSSPAKSVMLRIPLSIDAESLEVTLDGNAMSSVLDESRRLSIDLAEVSPRREHFLAIRVNQPRGKWLIDIARIEPPSFEGRVSVRRFYFELSLEPGEHLFIGPSRWTNHQRWTWNGALFERSSDVTQKSILEWIGGQPEVRSPTSPHRLTYSGVGPSETTSVVVLPTWFMVLIISGAVLAVGLGLVYLPQIRSVWFVLGGLAVCILSGVIWPNAAPLLIQAALPGIFLSLLSQWLRGRVTGVRVAVESRSGAFGSIGVGSSTREVGREQIVISASTTSREHGSNLSSSRSAS